MKRKQIIPVSSPMEIQMPRGPMIVLWTIREKGPLTFAELYQAIYNVEQPEPSPYNFLSYAIRELAFGGLIEVSGTDDPDALNRFHYHHSEPVNRGFFVSETSMTFEVTPQVDLIQRLFKLSITDWASGKNERIRIDPVFGEPKTWLRRYSDVFVLMPFAVELKPVYEDHILAVTRSLTLSCERGDDFFSAQSIVEEVWSAIYQAKVCIADCTGRNPNVFYEMGIAHTLGRPTILVSQSIDDIPFDIRHRRIIIYEYTPRGMKTFEESLAKTLQSELVLLDDQN